MRFLAVLVFCLSLLFSSAQTSIDEITTEFFSLYSKSPQKAIYYAFSSNKWMMDRKKDAVESIKRKVAGDIELLGKYYGYEKITSKSIGDSFVLVSFMVKYDRQPIRFTFVFYMPDNKWQLQNFKYDVALDEELEEAARAYRLRENR